MNRLLSFTGVYRANRLLEERPPELTFQALRGQLTELSTFSGHAALTRAVELIAQSHRLCEPAAWIGPSTSLFYPPDAARWQLDWSALAIIRLDDAHQAGRAADRLLRSGGFGLVIVDLPGAPELPAPLLGRLLRQAKNQDSALIFLTRKGRDSPSISSLVALRAQARWTGLGSDRLEATFTVVKDKRHGPGRQFQELYDGPLGLR